MNLATIEAIREGIAKIAKENWIVPAQNDYRNGVTELHQRIDNYLCELIAENGGEVKEPEVFRYIEVRKIVGFGLYDPVHREQSQEPGNMLIWTRRIKELEAQVDCKTHFVTVCEYDIEQLLIDHFLDTDKDPEQWAGYTETEQNCRGCMGPCGMCDQPDTAEPEIPWYALPDWVRYVAMDEDGQWYAYDCKPICVEEQWALDKTKSDYDAYRTGIIPFTDPDWRTSLHQRPAKTSEQ